MANSTSKKGFVLYEDTLGIAICKLLPTMEDRGRLLTSIYEFVSKKKEANPKEVGDLVFASFEYIRNGIELSNNKYLNRKKAQKAYYDKKRAENTLLVQNNCNGNGDGNGNGNGNGDGNGDGNNENINNNSLSENKITYSEAEVAAILEEREIFLKKNHLKDFVILNRDTFKWKYDPYSAALIYIKHHPDAVKKGKEIAEKAPQGSAAPPADVARDYMATLRAKAVEWWGELLPTLRAGTAAADVVLLDKIEPVKAAPYGFSNKEITLYVPDIETYHFAGQRLEARLKELRFARIEYKMPDDVKAAVEQELAEARETHFKRRRTPAAPPPAALSDN